MFFSQIGSSLHFSALKWVIQSLLDHVCESGMRNWSDGVIWHEIKVLDLVSEQTAEFNKVGGCVSE